MAEQQPQISAADGSRHFACSPVAVLAIIVNEREEILLLTHPQRRGRWEVVNGAMEAGETVLQAALRETREEIGRGVLVRPLGIVHVSTFHYDEDVRFMLSVAYLMAYEGGQPRPGDDMAGSAYRWWNLADMAAANVELIIPLRQKWLLARAVQLYRLWKHTDPADLPGFNLTVRGKRKG